MSANTTGPDLAVFPPSFPSYKPRYPGNPAEPFFQSLPSLVQNPMFLKSLGASILLYSSFFFAGRAYFARGASTEFLQSKDYERRTSWLLTLLSCTVMTIAGFLALPGFFIYGYDFASYPFFGASDLSFHLNVGFLAYLMLDLSLGLLFYPSQITLLNGYFHHSLYSFVGLFAIHKRLPMAFILFWPEELPMVLMSIGALNPSARVNKRYGFSYFVTRIIWHLWLAASLWRNSRVLGMVAGGLFPLNAYWFTLWVKQQIRKRKERRRGKKGQDEGEIESDTEPVEGEEETQESSSPKETPKVASKPPTTRKRRKSLKLSSATPDSRAPQAQPNLSRLGRVKETFQAAWSKIRQRSRPGGVGYSSNEPRRLC